MRRSVRIERRLDADGDEVATVLADVAAWERWTPFLHSVEILQEADGIHRLRVTTPLHRQGRPFLAEVIAGAHSLRLRELERHDPLEGRWSWRDEGDATRLELELVVDTPLLHFRTRVLLERAAHAWIDHLEAALAQDATEAGDLTEIYRARRDDGTAELRMRHHGRAYRLVPEEAP